jgi:hypothetical protein
MAFVWYSATLDWSTKLATGTFGVFHLINRRLHSAISTASPKLDQIILISTTLHHTPHIHRQKETMCQSTSCSTCRKHPHPFVMRITTAIMHLYLPTYLYLPHNLTVSLFSPQQKAQPGTAAALTSPQSWTPCHRASAATADRRSRGTARCTLLEVSYLPLIHLFPSLSLSLSISM